VNIDWVVLVNGAHLVQPVHGANNGYDMSWGKAPQPLLQVPESQFVANFTIEILMIGDSIGDVELSKSALEVSVTAVS